MKKLVLTALALLSVGTALGSHSASAAELSEYPLHRIKTGEVTYNFH
jgi:hypothetical protein